MLLCIWKYSCLNTLHILFYPGTFKPTQYVDVIGMVADNRNPFLMCPETIHSLPLSFLGKSDPLSVKKQPVFNPG